MTPGKLNRNLIKFGLCLLFGVIIYFLPHPAEITDQAWMLFSIFVFTILAIVVKPFPMGAIAFMGMTLCVATKTLTFAEAFSGFSNEIVWLIVAAFFIARGFIKTGLGLRIAYWVVKILGKSTLGLGYGIAATDLILAPAIPSQTARAGGVIYPMLTSLCKVFESFPHSHPRRIGAYLVQSAFQGASVTSSMFLTSMAGNPLIADFAREVGVNITWGKWLLASSVPGLICLITMPYILFKIYPPEIKETPDAKRFAEKSLKELGPVSKNEWIMLFVFFLLIILWVLAPIIHVKAAVTALIGLSLLIICDVLNWDDVIKEKSAWDTLIWFAVLIMMASFLNKLGLTGWFSKWVVGNVQGFHWISGFLIIVLVYFYTHYFFASNIAHIGSMYPAFLLLSIALGTPPMLAALVLGFSSNLFGTLTHYGSGPAPIFFGAGYIKVGVWWKLGFIFSVINLFVWIVLGGCWWKVLGLW